jgi:acyl-CoA synthetase (NDP forming)
MNNQALMGNLLEVVSRDPGLDAVFCMMDPPASQTPAGRFTMNILEGIGQALKKAPIPAFLFPMTGQDIRSTGRAFLDSSNIPFISGGIRIVIPALGKLMHWSARYREMQTKEPAISVEAVPAHTFATTPTGTWSEHQSRALLKQHDIPIIPARLATDVEQAVAAAQDLGFPVALKIASPDILHKSDIGGVRLELTDEEAVRTAFAQIMDAARSITPTLHIEGVLVSPMRSGGVELLVGITRDPVWGLVLAVGIGGIWVELLKDTSLRVLPVTRDDVRGMLTELQGAKLLQGARGSQSADMDALVDVIYRVSRLAESLKTDLESLEINPLRVDGHTIEALDAVISWRA